jgi:hypothetical protein
VISATRIGSRNSKSSANGGTELSMATSPGSGRRGGWFHAT